MSLVHFDCAAIQQSVIKIEKVWGDANANRLPFIAEVDSAVALIGKQTQTIEEVQDPKKKRSVKITWIEDCEDDVPVTVLDRCAVGGSSAGFNCEEYTIDQFTKRGFTIEETQFETSNYAKEEVLAMTMLMKQKKADEAIAQAIVAQIGAFKGTNQYTGGVGIVSGTTTDIPATAFDANLMGYFYKVAKLNKISNPFLLSGDNLFDQAWQIMMQVQNTQNGAGDLKKLKSMELINDLFNMESALPGKTLMISPSSYSFASRARNSEQPVSDSNGANMTTWKQRSKNIPGLWYDYTYKTRCVSDLYYHDFGFTAFWDVFQAPKSCNAEYTGILEFECAD